MNYTGPKISVFDLFEKKVKNITFFRIFLNRTKNTNFGEKFLSLVKTIWVEVFSSFLFYSHFWTNQKIFEIWSEKFLSGLN